MVPVKQSDTLRRIIVIRYLVGFLGEKSQCNWWSTSFYTPSSVRFLEPVFSRTTPAAKYHGAVEAARRFHDENLSVGSFHIFRLPEEIEQDLHELVQTQSLDLFAPSLIMDRSTALDSLSNVTGRMTDEPVGPVFVGKIGELRTSAFLNKVSEIYRQSLSSNTQALPYLVL
jgi:hypothetical protein